MKTIRSISGRFASSPLGVGVLLFAVALLVRLAVIIHFKPYLDLGRYELERTSISLATNGIYGNPYAIPTGPTAHVSPGYTLVLAAIFHFFGTATVAEIIKELLASAVSSFQIALLPALARALALDVRAGLLAGFVMALYPARPLVEIDGDWETPYIALSLMLAAVLAVRVWMRRELPIWLSVAHGICWGVALLFVGALLPLFISFLVACWFPHRYRFRTYLSFAALQIVVVTACLSPWIIRNYLVLGSPVVTRTNAGIELRISNNNFAASDQRENYLRGLFGRYHPLQSAAEAAKVRRLGEVEYNRRAIQEAKTWIREHPKRFIELTLGRIRCFWFYIDPTSRVKTAYCWLVSSLGLAGLAFALVEKRISGTILGIIAFVYPLPNYLVHVGLRQSYPIEWLLLLLGAALVTGNLTRRGLWQRNMAAVSS